MSALTATKSGNKGKPPSAAKTIGSNGSHGGPNSSNRSRSAGESYLGEVLFKLGKAIQGVSTELEQLIEAQKGWMEVEHGQSWIDVEGSGVVRCFLERSRSLSGIEGDQEGQSMGKE